MTESELAPEPQPPQKILIIDPSKTAREKAAALVKQLGHDARLASDAFEAHALVDGTGIVIATHPASQDIYPRLRAAGIPLVAAFPPRQARAFEMAARLGA